MAKKTLTIDGITFPDFGDDKSKKNFRLIFFIGYTDKKGDKKAAIVSKPDGGQWQWRKAEKPCFLPSMSIGDSVELDTSVLSSGFNGFSDSDEKIAEIDGKVSSITVQFVDVFDSSVKSFLKSGVLPQVIEQLKNLGINPIDLIPVPGVFTAVIKEKINADELATKFQGFLTKKNEDKLLNSLSAKYDGKKKKLEISGRKEWKKGKTGTYAVTIGFK